MNLGQSIRSGAKWLVVGKFGDRMMEFAFGVILARLLVPADFGMIVTIHVFTGLAGMLASGGMGQSLIRAKTADDNDFNAVFTLQMALGALIYILFFVAAPWIAEYFANPLYTDLIRVSTLVFLIRPFAMMRVSWLNRAMQYKQRSLIEIMIGLIGGVAGTLMALIGLGVWSLTLAGLIAAAAKNIMLSRITPLKLRPSLDFATMRKHSRFGLMITANDFVSYLRREGRNLILSKMAGPAFLGLFNKGNSLSRLPNQLMMSSVMEPLFRAMGKSQENLDQTKYMFYRSITLLIAYTTPLYVLLWWIAEPFISFVYGEKWIEAAIPMRVLATAGVFLSISHPCGVVLAAQNRLGKEMVAQIINLGVIVAACYIGLEWGLEGVAWGIVLSHGLLAVHFYWLVHQTLPTRVEDLLRAVAPGLSLSALLLGVLTMTDYVLGDYATSTPLLYLLAMSLCGGLFYAAAFLFIPIPALQTEAARWRQKLGVGMSLIRKDLK